MERFPNKGYGAPSRQAEKGEHLLTPNELHASGRKLYTCTYSRNLNDTCVLPPVDERNLDITCALPPVGEKRRRGILINQYGEGDIIGASADCDRMNLDAWNEIPTITLENDQIAPRVRPDWKGERKMRVENAMRRVQQSYVGELRYEDQQVTYVRPEAPKLQENRRPRSLVPLEHRPIPNVNVGGLRVQQEVYNPDQIDRSVLNPSKARSFTRSIEEEMELDMKRQILLERKIREANEFHRKQKLNAFKPVKEKKEKSKQEKKEIVNTATLSPPHHDLYKPVPPIKENKKEKIRPAPPSVEKQEESYSKRKRRLRPCATNMIEDQASDGRQSTGRGVNVAPPSQPKTAAPDSFLHTLPGTTKEGRHGMSFDVDTREFEKKHAVDEPTRETNTRPRPQLIPRQASFNIWNGETAKRGLGFKSKLRKEMEEASLRNVKPEEEFSTVKQNRAHVSSDVATRWKRKMFHNN